jgi:hypothetical protein
MHARSDLLWPRWVSTCSACRRPCRCGKRVSMRRSGGLPHAPWPQAGGRLVSLWGVDRGAERPGGLRWPMPCRKGWSGWNCVWIQRAPIPTCRAFPCAARMQRAWPTCRGCRPKGRPTTRPGSTTACGRADHRCRWAGAIRRRRRAPAGRLSVRACRRRRRARDRRRPGARRHHRARPLPLLGGGREGAAARSSTWATCTRASSGASPNWRPWTAPPGRARVRRFDRRLRLGLLHGARIGLALPGARARHVAAGADARARARGQPPGRPRRLGNDAALGFGLAQFSRLREDWQRLSGEAFGHRLMMDARGARRRGGRPRRPICCAACTRSATPSSRGAPLRASSTTSTRGCRTAS